MHLDWAGLIGIVGPLSQCILFVVLGFLSRRLGRVTRTRPYYIGLFIAAALVGISAIIRMAHLGLGADTAVRLHEDGALVILYTGFTALGVTIGAFVTWRYWSWLLAERS